MCLAEGDDVRTDFNRVVDRAKHRVVGDPQVDHDEHDRLLRRDYHLGSLHLAVKVAALGAEPMSR